MDLRLYSRVIWRFRLLVLTGLLIAFALAFLSFFTVDTRGKLLDANFGISYRQSETWQSNSTLLVTQRGCPWCRITFPSTVDEKGDPIPGADPYASPQRFTSLAVFYSFLANSDAVRDIIRQQGRPVGEYVAKPVRDPSKASRATLPFITISGVATTPGAATSMSLRATTAFKQFLAQRQEAAKIPLKEQVRVQIVNSANRAQLVKGRRLTIPIVVFLTALIATLGMAFVLENLRPRVRSVPAAEEPEPRPTMIGERHSA